MSSNSFNPNCGGFSIALTLTSPEYAHFEDSMDCDDRTSSKASGCPNTAAQTRLAGTHNLDGESDQLDAAILRTQVSTRDPRSSKLRGSSSPDMAAGGDVLPRRPESQIRISSRSLGHAHLLGSLEQPFCLVRPLPRKHKANYSCPVTEIEAGRDLVRAKIRRAQLAPVRSSTGRVVYRGFVTVRHAMVHHCRLPAWPT